MLLFHSFWKKQDARTKNTKNQERIVFNQNLLCYFSNTRSQIYHFFCFLSSVIYVLPINYSLLKRLLFWNRGANNLNFNTYSRKYNLSVLWNISLHTLIIRSAWYVPVVKKSIVIIIMSFFYIFMYCIVNYHIY